MFLELPEQSVLCSQKRTSLPTSQSKLKWRKRPASPSQSPTPDPLPCPVTLETAAGPSSRVHSLHLGSRFLPLKSSQTSFCGLFSPMSTTSPFSWLRWGKYLDKPEALPILMNPQIKSLLLHIPLQPSSSSSPIRSSTTPNETLFSTHTQVIRPWEDWRDLKCTLLSERRLKRLHTVQFHLYDMLARQSYRESKETSSCPQLGREG